MAYAPSDAAPSARPISRLSTFPTLQVRVWVPSRCRTKADMLRRLARENSSVGRQLDERQSRAVETLMITRSWKTIDHGPAPSAASVTAVAELAAVATTVRSSRL